jgi:hypothetical protein
MIARLQKKHLTEHLTYVGCMVVDIMVPTVCVIRSHKAADFLWSFVTLTTPPPGVGRGKANTETTQKFSKPLVS